MRGRRLGPRGLGEEERDDAVPHVPTHESAGIDDALIGDAHQSAPEREVAGGRQSSRQRGRTLQVGEQDRRRAPRRFRDQLHPFHVAGVAHAGQRPDGRHRSIRLRDDRRAGEARRITDPDGDGVNAHRPVQTHAPGHEEGRRCFVRRELVDDVDQLGVHHTTERVAATGRVGQHEAAETDEELPVQVGGAQPHPPAEPYPHGLGSEEVLPDRERCEPLKGTERQPQPVGGVHQPPLVVDDQRPLTGRLQCRRDPRPTPDAPAADTSCCPGHSWPEATEPAFTSISCWRAVGRIISGKRTTDEGLLVPPGRAPLNDVAMRDPRLGVYGYPGAGWSHDLTTENVAVLFTDMVGSTALASNLAPDGADEFHREHFSVLRQAVAEAGGSEVKNLGDGLMMVFASTSAALSCAVGMQQGIERDNRSREQLIGLRVGLSVGESRARTTTTSATP